MCREDGALVAVHEVGLEAPLSNPPPSSWCAVANEGGVPFGAGCLGSELPLRARTVLGASCPGRPLRLGTYDKGCK